MAKFTDYVFYTFCAWYGIHSHNPHQIPLMRVAEMYF